MKIAIVGLGGVGGYYGGKLARHYADRNDVEVIFVARGEHLKAIRENGLQQITEEGTFTAMPHQATDNPIECGMFDLVLFCVKAYDLEDSANILKNNITNRTVVISLLNGVDNAERLKAVLPKAQVLNGCVYIGAHIVRPGVVRQAGGSCKLFFGGESDESIDWNKVEDTLKAANIDAEYKKEIKNLVWEKYLFVSPFASATTLLCKTMRELLDSVEGKELLEGLLEEIVLVAKAQAIEIPHNIQEVIIGKASTFPYETKTSMQMDFENGKKTEIETFTGYIVTMGQKHQIAVPHHQMVYDALQKRLSAY